MRNSVFYPFIQISLVFILIAMLTGKSGANNISISDVKLVGTQAQLDAGYTIVQFDIAWENSWRLTNNWDAAWIFVKFNDGSWKHAILNNTGHSSPSGCQIDVGLKSPGTAFNATSNPGIGVFLYRSSTGSGNVTFNDVQLQWNFGSQNPAVLKTAIVDVQVFAIEMVYVPQGPYWIGNNSGADQNKFTATEIDTDSKAPDSQTISAGYPNGFNKFYCMKYEISQQQYVDFLNTTVLPANRKHTPSIGTNRCYVGISAGIYYTVAPYVAMNYLRVSDLLAYLDWSGLRLMTEMEFEKACRGTSGAKEEYAWGTLAIIPATGINPAAGNPSINEIPTAASTPNTLHAGTGNYQGGPMRVGAFATSTSDRVQAGATFYGIMEMSGNLFERVIPISNTNYTGNHGDGMVNSTTGYANEANWPVSCGPGESVSCTDIPTVGMRGGSYSSSLVTGKVTRFLVSDRNDVSATTASESKDYGGRGVRTAP